MASILKVNTFTGASTAGSIAVTGEGNSTTTNLQQGLAKSWTNAEQIGTNSVRDSFNMASVTDNGTGNFTVTFTNAMATARYPAPGGCYASDGKVVGTLGEATTGTNMRIADNGGSVSDTDSYMAIIGTMA